MRINSVNRGGGCETCFTDPPIPSCASTVCKWGQRLSFSQSEVFEQNNQYRLRQSYLKFGIIVFTHRSARVYAIESKILWLAVLKV